MKNILLELWNDALLAPATCVLMLITILVSIFGFYNKRFFQRCTLHPYSVYRGKQWYTILTAGFVHRNGWHLLVNIAMIYLFGTGVEENSEIQITNKHYYVILLFFCGLSTGNIGSVLIRRNDFLFSSVGASGAVLALFVTDMVLTSSHIYFVLPFLGEINGFHLAIYFPFAFLLALKIRPNDPLDHWSHFFGTLSGLVLAFLLFPQNTRLIIESYF